MATSETVPVINERGMTPAQPTSEECVRSMQLLHLPNGAEKLYKMPLTTIVQMVLKKKTKKNYHIFIIIIFLKHSWLNNVFNPG